MSATGRADRVPCPWPAATPQGMHGCLGGTACLRLLSSMITSQSQMRQRVALRANRTIGHNQPVLSAAQLSDWVPPAETTLVQPKTTLQTLKATIARPQPPHKRLRPAPCPSCTRTTGGHLGLQSGRNGHFWTSRTPRTRRVSTGSSQGPRSQGQPGRGGVTPGPPGGRCLPSKGLARSRRTPSGRTGCSLSASLQA